MLRHTVSTVAWTLLAAVVLAVAITREIRHPGPVVVG